MTVGDGDDRMSSEITLVSTTIMAATLIRTRVVTDRPASRTLAFRPEDRPLRDPSGQQGAGARSRTAVTYQ